MADKASTPPAEQTYLVLHGAVGNFWSGQTVTAADLGAPGDPLDAKQIQRLLDLEALAPAGSRKAEDARGDLPKTTPTGESVEDADAVARQVQHARDAVKKPPKDD